MAIQSFAFGGVSYRQELIACGKKCGKCPNHGPYWYAYWWSDGKVKKVYVGKKLPEGIRAPAAQSGILPTAPKMSKVAARKLLGLTAEDTYLTGHMRWQTQRKFLVKQGESARWELVALDAAWELVCDFLR